MSDLISSVMPHAIAVAVSPIPIAALILILLSKRATENSIAYLFGWIIALIVNIGFFALAFHQPFAHDHDKSMIGSTISLILGVLLIILSIKQWRSRPKKGQLPHTPKWMNLIERFTPGKSFAVAFALVTINAKNTILDIDAGVLIGQKANSLIEALITLSIYVLVASSTIIIPVLAFLIFGRTLSGILKSLKAWFIYHNSTILFVLFLLLGANIIYKTFN